MRNARFATVTLFFLAVAATLRSPTRGDDSPAQGDPIPAKKRMDCVYGAHRPSKPEDVKAAAKAAVAENPENAVRVDNGVARSAKGDAVEATPLGSVDEKGIISTGRKWRPGRTLHIKFLGGEPAVRRKVQQQASEWTKHANIQFQFVGDAKQAEVRIAFRPGGSWSLLGTDALTAPADQETMNFGWLGPDSDEPTYSSVVLHEFGHMLGLVHEHMFPGPEGIKWDREKAYEYYGETQGWDRAMVDAQVLNVYTGRDASMTARPDLNSIMMYPIPEGLASNAVVGWNVRLSPTDIEFIGRHYFPAPGLKPTLLAVGSEPTFGEVAGQQVAAYRFRAERAGEYLVRVRDVPLEVSLLADGPALLARGEAAGAQPRLILGTRLQPGEYTVRLRLKDPNETGSGQFEISVKRAD
jgi:hypothetical protein